MVWTIAPKAVSTEKIIVDIAVNIAMCIYNDGMSSAMKIMEVLGITIGSNSYKFGAEADLRHTEFSDWSLSNSAKESRLLLKSTRKDEQKENINIEGQLYGAMHRRLEVNKIISSNNAT